jgi:hypothetical protein
MPMKKAGMSFTDARRKRVNSRKLTGGEIPSPDLITPEEIAHHVEAMVCSFWNWPGNGECSNAEMVYTVALGSIRAMQKIASDAMNDENTKLKDLLCRIDQWIYDQSELQKDEGPRVDHDAACELWDFSKKRKNRRCTCGLTGILKEVAKIAKKHGGKK